MSRRLWILLAALTTALAALVPVAAGAQTTTDGLTYTTGGDYFIVTLNGKPAANDDTTKTNGRFDPNSKGYAQALSRMQRQHAKFAANLAKTAPNAEIVDEFYITANAVAMKLNGSSKAAIGKIAGVERTADSNLYQLDMDQSVGLINANDFWTSVGGSSNAGAGVKVGVIDSGIDGTHEFFDCGTENRVHFGGVYASGVGISPMIPALPRFSSIFGLEYGPNNLPGPGDPLYFSSSHGTHVAGTIGGCETTIEGNAPWDGTSLSGVAPGAELYDYNVFPYFGAGMVAFDGSAFSHDIAAAIEDAVADGMDVINMSLGGSVQGPHDFLAEASNAAVAAGVVVVTSAGNEGPGAYTVGSPGVASEVIAVGASTNTRGMGVTVTTDPDGAAEKDFGAVPGEFPNFDGVTVYDLIDWPGADNTACSGGDVSGLTSNEVVLISRGGCTFEQKVENAAAAGAGGVIVYNNSGGDPIGMAGVGTIPAVMVSQADGAELELLAPTTVVISEPLIEPTVPNLLADFSSRGPAPFTRNLKPDIVAPGVNILSSVLTFDFFGKTGEGWELYNGTSMASPHVAGAAAALLGEHGDWSPNDVKSALVTTANANLPAGWTVWETGGGLMDLTAADAASVFFYPASASFGHMKGNKPANGSIDITISGASCTTATANGSAFVDADVVGSTLTVTFTGGREAQSDFYGGYVDVDCGDDGNYHLPWGAVVDR